jgi:acetyltransferase-like isoleucine patch superfamily enzyme
MSVEYIVYANVLVGKNCEIDPFVILGRAPRGKAEGELPTQIGDDAVIRSHTVIYAGNNIGRHFQCGHHVTIRESNEIGAEVSIGTSAVVEHHVKIGDGVRIHSQAFIPEYSILDNACWIGPNVVLTNARYPRSPNVKNELRGPRIRGNAKIGANVTILPGIEIGENSLIGAGSVVTKSIPANVIAAGNPARVLREVHYR